MGFGIYFSLGVQIETILQEEKRPFTTPCMFVSLPASSNVETCNTSTFSASMTRFLSLLMLAILGCSGFLNCEHGDLDSHEFYDCYILGGGCCHLHKYVISSPCY